MDFVDRRQSGSLAAQEDAVIINSPGTGTVVAQLSGTFSATVTFEATLETGASPTWVAVPATNVATGTSATTATAAGLYRINAASLHRIRARCSAFVSGPVSVILQASAGSSGAQAGGTGTGGGTVDTELPAAQSVVDDLTLSASPSVIAVSYGFDGANFDRTITFPGAADGRNTSNTGLLTNAMNMVFNGTTWDRARGNTTAQFIQGAVATGSAASGEMPVLIAGQTGAGLVGLSHVVSGNADGNVATLQGMVAPAIQWAFNGSTWDRVRNNLDVTALASASRTTTQTVNVTNYNGRAIHVVLNMTVVGTGSVTLSIVGVDAVSSATYTILAGLAVVTNSTNVYKVGPGLTAAANAVANDVLPRSFNIVVTANNANAATYSVGYSLITA